MKIENYLYISVRYRILFASGIRMLLFLGDFCFLLTALFLVSFCLVFANRCHAWGIQLQTTSSRHRITSSISCSSGNSLLLSTSETNKWTATALLLVVKDADEDIGYFFQPVKDKPYVSDQIKRVTNSTEPQIRQFLLRTLLEGQECQLEDCMQQFLRSPSDAKNDDCEDGYDFSHQGSSLKSLDALWEQIRMEAQFALEQEPMAGPQLTQGILSQPSLLSAVCSIVANEIATELMPATAMQSLMLSQLLSRNTAVTTTTSTTSEIVRPHSSFYYYGDDSSSSTATTFATTITNTKEEYCIQQDIMASAIRSMSIGNALSAVLFCKGFHALVCYRVAHKLWQSGRTGLAKYLQSTVSRKYAVDIHPAAKIGAGVFLGRTGIVIGETAVVGNDVTILEGVTLGGTGKERGDRHPKIGNNVILLDSCSVLGNIAVGNGAVILSKSIVTKPVPPLARVSGVPAKLISYRKNVEHEEGGTNGNSNWATCVERYLKTVYLRQWNSIELPV